MHEPALRLVALGRRAVVPDAYEFDTPRCEGVEESHTYGSEEARLRS